MINDFNGFLEEWKTITDWKGGTSVADFRRFSDSTSADFWYFWCGCHTATDGLVIWESKIWGLPTCHKGTNGTKKRGVSVRTRPPSLAFKPLGAAQPMPAVMELRRGCVFSVFLWASWSESICFGCHSWRTWKEHNGSEWMSSQMSMVRFSVQQRLPVALWIHGLQVTQSPLRRRWLGLQKLSHGPDS